VDEETRAMIQQKFDPWKKEGEEKEGNGTRSTKRKRYLVML
jgi:hypothetical protein